MNFDCSSGELFYIFMNLIIYLDRLYRLFDFLQKYGKPIIISAISCFACIIDEHNKDVLCVS